MKDLIKYLEEISCGGGKREIIVPIISSQIEYFKKLEYNTDTSALLSFIGDEDIVRTV